MIKGSQSIKDQIKVYEGYVETPKEDNDGNYILGYGIQVDPKVKTKTTLQDAERDFEGRVALAEEELSPLITRSLTQKQQDALVDTHYNMGLTKMVKHGIIDLVNAGRDEELSALFRRLNKAENYKTGKMEAMGNLPDRASNRANLWLDQSEPSPVAQMQESASPEDIISEVQQFHSSGEAQVLSDEDLISEVASFGGETDIRPGAQFDTATEISDENSLESQKKAQAIAKEFNVPRDVVEGMLLSESEDTIRTRLSAPDIKSKYPGVAKWASSPENNALLKKTKDYPKKLERAVTKISENKKDWQKAIDSNFVRLEDSTVIGQMIFGSINKNEGIKRLRELDTVRNANTINSPEVEAIKEALTRVGSTFQQEWDSVKNVALGEDATSNIINILKATTSAGISTAEDAAAFIFTAAKHPEAYAQFMVESSGAPVAAGVIGSVAGTPIVGAGAAYATGSLVAFGGKVREEMEKFRDPKTMEIDYERFFSDPARLATLRTEAVTYGLTIGAVETAFQFMGGKFLSKAIPKNPVLAPVATAVGGAVSEGAGETLARTAGQVASGQEVTVGQNIAEGVMEAGAAGPLAAGGALTQAAINPRKGVIKTTDTLQKASKANEDVNALSELKEHLKTDPATKDYSEQVAELIDTSVEEVSAQTEIPETEDIEIEPKESKLEATQEFIRQKAKTGTVSFTPSEWETFNATRGIDPFEALGVFSPRTQSAYQNSRESDAAIVIPLSEWAIATEEDPDIDQIVRINGNDFNNLEANELIDAFEKNPLVFFDTMDQSSDMEDVAIQVVEGEDSTPLRPLDLTSSFQTIEEQEAFDNFRRRLNRALPGSVQPELADDIAQLQLRHLRLRSAVSGLPIQDVLARLQFGRKQQGTGKVTMPTFDKDFFTIAFGKDGDANTVIHELAHTWLYEMAEDYQLLKDIDLNTAHGDVRAYREAMDVATELLGMQSLDEVLSTDSEARTRRIQETFAQTAEDYFMKGTSENSRIRRLMERMRTWLAKHINRLRNLTRKYPTLAINPKTEFLFDAILAATKASEDQVYSMFPEPMFSVAELGPGAAGYMATIHEARSQAIGETYFKAFNKKGLKENERIFETEYDRISREAEAEVDSYPSMILRAQMLDAYQDYKKRGGESDPRISYESAKEYLTDGTDEGISELKKNVPYFMLTGKKKGGIPVPDFMNLVGVNNAADLREMLLEANSREQIIQEEIDRKLSLEAQPLLKSPDEMHRIAEEAVNSAGREKIIREEFKILMEQYPTQFVRATSGLINTPESLDKVTRDVYKAEAALMVGATPALNFSSENFLRDMNRLRRDATKAFKQKDFEKAISKKVQEARMYYAYREALKAEKDLAKSRVQVKNLEKAVRNRQIYKSTYDYDTIEYAVKVVQAVRNGQQVEPLLRENLPESASLSQTNIDVVNEAVSKLVDEPGGQNLTVNGAVNLGNITKTLMKIAREIKKLDLEEASVSLDEAVFEDTEKMSEGNVVEFPLAGQEGASIFKAAKTSNTKLRAALDQMYKSTEDFATSNLGKIFSWIGSAEAARDVELRELRKELRTLMNKFPKNKNEKIVASSRFEWIPFIDKTDSPIFWDNAKLKFENMGEMLTAILYMGSESGAKKFLYGKGLANKANIAYVIDDFWAMVNDKFEKKVLTREHLEFVEATWKKLDELHPRIKQVLYETEGYPMGKIEGWEVNTPIGKLKGGYFPVVHSKNTSVEDFTKMLDGGSNLVDLVRAFPGKDTRMALDRTEFYGDVNLNLNALNAYLEAASNVIHLRKPLIAFSKFIHHPAFMNVLENRRPGLYDNMIKPWMERTKLQSYIDPNSRFNGLNPLIKMLRQNTGISFFFGNLSSVFRQTLGTFQALPEVGPKYMASSAADFVLSPITVFKKATELSDVMKDRMFSSQTKFISVVEDLNRANDVISKSREGVEKLTYLPLQAAQSITDLVVWNAAYTKMISKEKTSKEAVSYADSVVKKSQGSSNISEMTNLQYGSEATKWFTQFSTVPLINYELATEALRRGERSTPKKAWAVSMALTVAVMAPLIVDVLILEGLFGDEDEEDKKDKDTLNELILKRGSGAMLESFAPTVGKYAGSALAYGKPTFSPSGRKVEDNTAKALKGLEDYRNYGTDLTPAQVKGVSELLTILTGAPLSLYGKLEVYNHENLSENEKRIKQMDRRIQRRKAQYARGEF